MKRSVDIASRASRIYEGLLWLYPPDYRREYGPLMAQFFRDEYRAARRAGTTWAFSSLIGRTIRDLALSAFREHLSEQSNHMKNLSVSTLSLGLFVVAITAPLLSCHLALTQPSVAVGLAYFSGAALLLRAFLEWKRPDDQLARSLAWGTAIALIYSVILPVWGKVKLPVIPFLVVAPMFLNAIVPLVRTALRLTRSRS
jgi:hypothetical protein